MSISASNRCIGLTNSAFGSGDFAIRTNYGPAGETLTMHGGT
jgi:hypothetical protein